MLLKCCQTEKKTRTVGNAQKRSAGSSMRLTTTSDAGQRVQRKVVRAIAPKRTHRGVKEEPAVDPTCDNSNDSGLGFEQHQEYNVTLRLVDPDSTWAGERLGLSRDPNWSNGSSRLGWASESPEVKRKRLEIKIESDDANDDFSFPDSVRQTQLLLPSPPYPVNEHMSAPRPVKRPGQCAQRRAQTTLAATQLLAIHKDSKPLRGRVPGPNVLANRNKNPGANILASQLLGLNGKVRGKAAPSMSANQAAAVSRDGKTQLNIVHQPEQQHRARYQTEGSRGAVKDRTGNGFPQVQLAGWLGPATLEVYIGSDCGKVVPHMFYQACRVSGKNSTQCQERTEDGTVIIEVQFEPSKDMIVTCDCVGILKERNVDVEHRFPDQSGSRNKKKSTRCRMVFRTTLTHPDGSRETLQICSQPIACTQPPGVPEICKKSLTSSPACGGQELFILGKNFLKDTRVLLSNPDLQPPWEASVIPDKEYLQQSHLVCVVPPYHTPNISEPVTVRLTVMSSGKASEAHCFTYTPQPPVGTAEEEHNSTKVEQPGTNPSTPESNGMFQNAEIVTPDHTSSSLGPALDSVPPNVTAVNSGMEPMLSTRAKQYLLVEPKQGGERERVFPVLMWKSAVISEDISKSVSVASKGKELKLLSIPAARKDLKLMELPALVPLPSRRPSSGEVKTEEEPTKRSPDRGLCPAELKGIDLRMKPTTLDSAPSMTSGPKVSMATGADLSSTLPPSMATLRRFVANDNGSPLPSLSVENFLSRLESKPEVEQNGLKAEILSQTDCKLLNGDAITKEPGFIPLEAIISTNTSPANGTPRTVSLSNLRRLSGEEITSTSTESSHSIHGKPCKRKSKALPAILNDLHMTSMFSSQSPLAKILPNSNLSATSSTDHLLNVGHGQLVFPSQSNGISYENGSGSSDLVSSLASTDVRRVTTAGRSISAAESSVVSTIQDTSLDSLGTCTMEDGNPTPHQSQMTNQHKLKELVAMVANNHMMNAVNSICSPQPKNGDVIQSQLNIYSAGNIDNTTANSPPVGSPEMATVTTYVKDGVTALHTFPTASNNIACQSLKTSSFNRYVSENEGDSSLHSEPIETKSFVMPLQDPPYENHGASHVNSVSPISACNNILLDAQTAISTNNFIVEAGKSISTCSPRVTHVASQVLSELSNDHSAVAFHSTSPPMIEKGMLLEAQNSELQNNGYDTKPVPMHSCSPLHNGYVSEPVSLSSCSPPIPSQNILIDSHERSLFDKYVAEKLSAIGVSSIHTSQQNVMDETHHTSPLNSCGTESQTLVNTSIGSLSLPSNDILLNTDISKSHNNFGIGNQLDKTASTPLIGVTTSTCSPPVDGGNMFITSHGSMQLRSHELSTSASKAELSSSMSLGAVRNYDLSMSSHAHASENDVVNSTMASTLSESYPTHCVSVDTRMLDAGLRQALTIDTPNTMLSSTACPLPPTVGNMLMSSVTASGGNQLLDSSTALDSLINNSGPSGRSASSHCTSSIAIKNMISRSLSIDGERNTADVPTSSLGMTNLILHPATAMKSENNLSNHCTPSIAMKNLILSCGDMGSGKSMSGNCMLPTSLASIDEAGPVATTYGKVCSGHTRQIAMKDMMLRVDVSSTMDDQMVSQPGAITPETVRLDALVNSTLDNHIHATQSSAESNKLSMPATSVLEATSVGTSHVSTAISPTGPSTITTSSTLLDNIFPSNDTAKEAHIRNLQATTRQSETLQFNPAPSLSRCEMSGDLLRQITSGSGSAQFNSSTDVAHVSNSVEFRAEPRRSTGANVGFTVMSMNARFGVVPDDQHFTSAPANTQFQSTASTLQFACTSSNSRDILCNISKRNLSQLMDLEEHRDKTDDGCTQKGEHSLKEEAHAACQEGAAVRERREEGMLPQELTQMSDHDLISYINPSCFDQV